MVKLKACGSNRKKNWWLQNLTTGLEFALISKPANLISVMNWIPDLQVADVSSWIMSLSWRELCVINVFFIWSDISGNQNHNICFFFNTVKIETLRHKRMGTINTVNFKVPKNMLPNSYVTPWTPSIGITISQRTLYISGNVFCCNIIFHFRIIRYLRGIIEEIYWLISY